MCKDKGGEYLEWDNNKNKIDKGWTFSYPSDLCLLYNIIMYYCSFKRLLNISWENNKLTEEYPHDASRIIF